MSVLNAEKKETLTGAKIIVETLKKLGVDTIFGYPGGIVLSIYDELFKQNDIKHYLVRHEQAAVHAAEGYARVSGKCGVVLVTSGPGAANTVSGIANAYLDGYPVVVLTGQVLAPLIGKDAFQEVNIIDITKSCTKANFQVTSVVNLEETLIKAFETAQSGKQGPVVVDMAKNIFTETAESGSDVKFSHSVNSHFEGDIDAVLETLYNAKSPVIVTGGGLVQADASGEVFQLAKKVNIPVVSTMMGLGVYPPDDENYLGMIGIFGSPSANQVLRESDLILSFGARFNDRITCCFPNGELGRNFIQVDINKDEISRNIPASLSVVGDAKLIITEMLKRGSRKTYGEWLQKAIKLKSLNKPPEKISDKLHSFEVIRGIYDYTKGQNLVVTTEVGQHQLWTAQNYKFSAPGKFLTSGGSGTMGFGFPSAIGASIANGRQPVICIAGDGSFQMNEQELATCRDYNLPVKIFILNNGYLGMVRQLQQKGFDGRYSQTQISNPDFIKLAEAYGIKAQRVEKSEDIVPALERAFETDEPYIIDFIVEPMEVV